MDEKSKPHPPSQETSEHSRTRRFLGFAMYGLLAVVLFIGFSSFMHPVLAFLTFAVAVMLFGATCVNEIPPDPPHCGLMTFFGKRSSVFKREGYRVLIPVIWDAILIERTKRTLDIPLEGIRTGGISEESKNEESPDRQELAEVRMKVQIVYRPDERRLIEYLDAGREGNIRDILKEMIAEDIRQIAMGKKDEKKGMTWAELAGAQDQMSRRIIKKLTNEDISQEDVDKRNGIADARFLGIVVHRVNIASIDPSDALKKAAERDAVEIQQRRGELREAETDAKVAEILWRMAGGAMSREECLLEARRRRAIREGHGQVLDIPGLARIGRKN